MSHQGFVRGMTALVTVACLLFAASPSLAEAAARTETKEYVAAPPVDASLPLRPSKGYGGADFEIFPGEVLVSVRVDDTLPFDTEAVAVFTGDAPIVRAIVFCNQASFQIPEGMDELTVYPEAMLRGLADLDEMGSDDIEDADGAASDLNAALEDTPAGGTLAAEALGPSLSLLSLIYGQLVPEVDSTCPYDHASTLGTITARFA